MWSPLASSRQPSWKWAIPPGKKTEGPPHGSIAGSSQGALFTVSNSKIFDEPVFNYTRDFPYIWEELRIPIKYDADRSAAEKMMVEAASRHSFDAGTMPAEAVKLIRERYHIGPLELGPKVYYRLTDNWLELTVRFLVETHRVREAKSDMSRELLSGLDAAKIEIASSTFNIVGFPALDVNQQPLPGKR